MLLLDATLALGPACPTAAPPAVRRPTRTATMNADTYRLSGNEHFLRGSYADALADYNKAIALNADAASLWLNRALCHLKQGNWDAVLADSARARELEPTAVRVHYYAGCAHLALEHFAEAVTALKIGGRNASAALDLAQQQQLDYTVDIGKTLAQARKQKWQHDEQDRHATRGELHEYLNGLIEQDHMREVQQLEANAANLEAAKAALVAVKEARLRELDQVFQEGDVRYRRREVPDYLMNNITFEMLRDPVIAPSGITYERASVLEHLHRVGHFDPITRSKMTERDLIPNLAMKEVINDFLEQYG